MTRPVLADAGAAASGAGPLFWATASIDAEHASTPAEAGRNDVMLFRNCPPAADAHNVGGVISTVDIHRCVTLFRICWWKRRL
jgi:hypothetical protein